MIIRNHLFAASALLVTIIFSNPVAADWRKDLYIGGGVGASMLDGCESLDCLDHTSPHDNITAHDPGFKVFQGFQFHDFLGIELAYYDLGRGVDDDVFPGDTYDIRGGSLEGVVFLPIDENTRLFAKGGAFYGRITETNPPDLSDKVMEEGVSLIVGAGGDVNVFGDFTIRGEVEWIPNVANGGVDNTGPVDETGDIDALFASVSLIWHVLGHEPQNPLFSTGSGLSSRTGFYIGGGVLGASFDGGEDTRVDGGYQDVVTDLDVGVKGFAGYRFCKFAAIELGYNYFSDAKDDDGEPLGPDTFDAQGISFALMLNLPVSDRTTLFIKGGGIYGWLDEFDAGNPTSSPFGTHFGENGLSPLAGGGLNFDLTTNVSLRGEVEWMPGFADGNPAITSNLDDRDTGETADLDIIATSASLIWWFR
jgi:hypothetical protein